MDPFAGIENSKKPIVRLPKLKENKGEYVLEIVKNSNISAMKGDFVLAEFKVLESSGEGALPAGASVGASFYYSDKWFKQRFGEYYFAAMDTDTITGDASREFIGPKNPAKGRKVYVRAYDAVSDGGKPYVRLDWKAVPSDEQ